MLFWDSLTNTFNLMCAFSSFKMDSGFLSNCSANLVMSSLVNFFIILISLARRLAFFVFFFLISSESALEFLNILISRVILWHILTRTCLTLPRVFTTKLLSLMLDKWLGSSISLRGYMLLWKSR
uniref:Uncharacterized protein n=1 Tax=Cacopsylla melanoneura TaxID=428564 RepID=A0A8D8SPE6_9HEMI